MVSEDSDNDHTSFVTDAKCGNSDRQTCDSEPPHKFLKERERERKSRRETDGVLERERERERERGRVEERLTVERIADGHRHQ